MKAIFRPYQKFAREHLLNEPAAGLFLDLGLGKTLITLTAINDLLFDSFQVRKPLIVAPKRVAQTVWDAEIAKWDHLQHLRLSKIIGTEKERKAALRAPADLWITNVDNIRWLLAQYPIEAWPFDMLVIDELSKFKDNQSLRFKDLRKYRPRFARVVGLTATPTPNSLVELWPELRLLDGGYRLGDTVTGFRERFFIHDVYERKYRPRDGAKEEIFSMINDICISMSQKDYLDLPPLIEVEHEAILDPGEMKAYKDFERAKVMELANEEKVTAVNAAVLAGKLLQYAGGSIYDVDKNAHFVHDKKVEVLEELIEEANGAPVLVAYWFQHELEAILRRIPKAYVFGNKNVQQTVDKWNRGEIPIMVVQAQSAAHGLNLQDGGNIIIWFSAIWSSEYFTQFNGRLYRSGQTKPVYVNKILTRGTMDFDVNEAVKNKLIGQDALLTSIKAKLAEYGKVLDGTVPSLPKPVSADSSV
jgi:SNF2 family DNA or RNA helicase